MGRLVFAAGVSLCLVVSVLLSGVIQSGLRRFALLSAPAESAPNVAEVTEPVLKFLPPGASNAVLETAPNAPEVAKQTLTKLPAAVREDMQKDEHAALTETAPIASGMAKQVVNKLPNASQIMQKCKSVLSKEKCKDAAKDVAKLVLNNLPPDVSKFMQELRTSSGMLSQEPQCEKGETKRSSDVGDTAIKYEKSYCCANAAGMWGSADTAPIRQFKYDTMVQVMGLTRGHRVMDWGTGCGTELGVTAAKFGFKGFGIDMVQSNIDWASSRFKNSAYCLAEGSALPFQNSSFDAVISNAAFYHLKGLDAQIPAAQEILRVLRPGGCAWMAWLGCTGDHPVKQEEWNAILLSGAVLTTLNEHVNLGINEYRSCRKVAYSLIFCKK